MKQQIFLLMLSACLAFTSCTKNDDSEPEESNTIEIGGNAYPTVKIGTQTWTSINYNGTGGVGYNNESSVSPWYAKLYTWTEAKAIVLPTGWRLPTKADYEKLLLSLGGTPVTGMPNWVGNVEGDATVSKKLMSTQGWSVVQGNNSSGFNAYPAGNYYQDFDQKGETAEFWSSTINSTSDISILSISTYTEGSNTITDSGIYGTSTGAKLSVRFVKDN